MFNSSGKIIWEQRINKILFMKGCDCWNQSIELKNNDFTFDLGELVRQTDSERTRNFSCLYSMLCRKEQTKKNLLPERGVYATRSSTMRRYTCAALVPILQWLSWDDTEVDNMMVWVKERKFVAAGVTRIGFPPGDIVPIQEHISCKLNFIHIPI